MPIPQFTSQDTITPLRVEALRGKLRTLRISTPYTQEENATITQPSTPPSSTESSTRPSFMWRLVHGVGLGISAAWLIYGMGYAIMSPNILIGGPLGIGLFATGLLAPVALGALTLRAITYRVDMNRYTSALRTELRTVLFSSDSTLSAEVAGLCAQAVEVSTTVRDVLRSLARARQGLRVEVRDFAGVSQKAEFHVDRLAETLAKRAATLLEITQNIQTCTESFAQKTLKGTQYITETTIAAKEVLERFIHIDTTLENRAAAIGANGRTLLEGASALENQAQKLIEAGQSTEKNAQALEKTLRETTTALTVAQDEAFTATRNTTNAGNEILNTIRTLVSLLETERTHIQNGIETAKDQTHTMAQDANTHKNTLLIAAQELEEALTCIHESLDKPVEHIKTLIVDVEKTHAQIEQTLEDRTKTLHTTAVKAVETAATIRQDLHEGVRDMAALSAEITTNTCGIHATLKEQTQGLSTHVLRALEEIEAVGVVLEKRGHNVEDISKKAIDQMESAQNILKDSAKTIENISESALNRIADLDVAIGDVAQDLALRAGGVLTDLVAVRDGVTEAASAMKPVCATAIEHANTLQDRLVLLRTQYEEASQTITQELNISLKGFETKLLSLQNDVAKTTEDLTRSTTDVEKATLMATNTIEGLVNFMEIGGTNVHLHTDKVLLRMESVQKVLMQHFATFEDCTMQALSLLESVSGRFGTQASTTETKITKFSKSLENIATLTQDQISALAQATNTAFQEGIRAQERAHTLTTTTTHSLTEFQRTTDTFAARANALEKHLEESLIITDQHNKALAAHSVALAETATESTDRMMRAGEALLEKIHDLTHVADDGQTALIEMCTTLARETQHFLSSSQLALRNAKEAAAGFANQTSALERASATAAKEATAVVAASTRLRLGEFMGGAKFIVESLHSLCLDLTRMMNGNVDDRIWKAFQRGDMAAFSKHLAHVKDALPLDKARTKFANDGEFRAYVQRFLRHFEELWTTAKENDHGGLLASTFAGSDMGTLYHLLCDVAGRKAQLPSEKKVAA